MTDRREPFTDGSVAGTVLLLACFALWQQIAMASLVLFYHRKNPRLAKHMPEAQPAMALFAAAPLFGTLLLEEGIYPADHTTSADEQATTTPRCIGWNMWFSYLGKATWMLLFVLVLARAEVTLSPEETLASSRRRWRLGATWLLVLAHVFALSLYFVMTVRDNSATNLPDGGCLPASPFDWALLGFCALATLLGVLSGWRLYRRVRRNLAATAPGEENGRDAADAGESEDEFDTWRFYVLAFVSALLLPLCNLQLILHLAVPRASGARARCAMRRGDRRRSTCGGVALGAHADPRSRNPAAEETLLRARLRAGRGNRDARTSRRRGGGGADGQTAT